MPVKTKMPNSKNYPFTIRPLTVTDGGGYLIEYPDLPGCVSDGATIDEAIVNGQDAARSWLKTAAAHGDVIPEPQQPNMNYSGKWVMRVPKYLHRGLAQRAEQEGVSLNQFAATLLAHGLGQTDHIPKH